MTDPTTGGFADTPGPDATPEQDADVRALLAFLRDEPLEMPPDVAARLDAVIAEERRTAAARVASSLSPALEPADTAPSPHASVTVLPVAAERRRAGLPTAFKVVGGLAAAALVVVGGVTLVHQLGTSGTIATASGEASSAASAGGTAVTASGQAYTAKALAAQAAALVAGTRLPQAATADAPASAVPSPVVPSASAPLDASGGTASAQASQGTGYVATPFAPDRAAACVSALTDGDGSTGVAIDSGTYNGKPALVVVVTDPDDPTALRVFVTAPDCSPNFLQFQQISRP